MIKENALNVLCKIDKTGFGIFGQKVVKIKL